MKFFSIYIWPILFLLFVVSAIWYMFFIKDILPDNEKRITALIAMLGLGFGVFQFWVSIAISSGKRIFELRYEEYKQFVVLLESVTELLNDEMAEDLSNDLHGLISSLMNQINRIIVTINLNDEYLFKKIKEDPVSIELNKTLGAILLRADQHREKIEKEANKKNQEALEMFILIESMNWNNDTREYLKQLHSIKYRFYKKLRGYF